MSQFVNFNKRSITLPPGCKNLIDVLGPPSLREVHALIAAHQRATISRDGEALDKLTEIEKSVSMVFESRALAFTLLITTPDERLTLDVDRMEDGATWASVLVAQGTNVEKALRNFLSAMVCLCPRRRMTQGYPLPFFPDLPVHLKYGVSPLPPDAAQLSRLLTSLFREVSRLKDDSQLRFRYDELVDTPEESDSA